RAIMSRELDCLPLRALRHLAVTEKYIRPIRQAVEPARVERHAETNAEALAERARRGLGIREARRRMTFQPAAEMAERHQLLLIDAARHGPQGVEERRGVPLGEN